MAVLFSVAPLDPDTGARVTLRFCNRDDPRLTGLNDVKWWPGIAAAPTLSYEVFDGNFQSSVAVAAAAFRLNLTALRKAADNAPRYRWAGAAVNVYRGPDAGVWADFDLIFAGIVTDAQIQQTDVRITATVDIEPFDGNLLALKYGGTGGADGIEDLKDKVKPMCFGYARNVEPVMINTVSNVFQVHGYGPIEDIPMVYERAAEFGPSVGDFADCDALVAATIAEGHWGTCLAQGMFRLGAPPFGVITADVKGDNTGGWHRTTAEVIQRLCEIHEIAGDRLDTVSLDAFAAAVPFPINLYVTEQLRLIDLIPQLVRPCNAQGSLSWTGKLQVTRFGAIATPTMTLDAQGRQLPPVLDNAELNVSPPYWRMEMQAARCWRVMTKDEIAYEDPEPVPVTVYTRSPAQPDTPTGDGVPDGWSAMPPGYSAAVVSGGFPKFGPVWASTAKQGPYGATDDDGWSEPVLRDSEYSQWVLVSQNTGAKVLGATRGVKAADDFDPAADQAPYCFIDQPVTGAWILRCKVRGAGDRVAVGVVPTDPEVLDRGDDQHDVNQGIYIAQNDGYATRGPSGESATGVFVIQNWDPDSDFTDGRKAVVLEAPVDNCQLEISFNGETVEFYVNSQHVRTTIVNNAVDGAQYWPVFVPLSPNAEVYDIQWGRGTQATTLDYQHDFSEGCIRRSTDEIGWETYAPAVTSGTGVGLVYSKTFQGGCFVTFKVGAFAAGTVLDDLTANFVYIDGVGYFAFYADGTFNVRRESGGILASGTWVAGDEFGMVWQETSVFTGWVSYTNHGLYFQKNGENLGTKKLPTPSFCGLTLELGAGGKLYDINFVPKEPTTGTSRASTTSPSITTPVSDTSPTVTGGFIVLGETPDIPFTTAGPTAETVAAAAQLLYTKTAGAAASVTPEVKLQYSTDGGNSWADLGASVTGAASTGAQQTLNVSSDQNVTGSGTRRYRLLAKNTVAGTFTLQTSGYLAAQWIG